MVTKRFRKVLLIRFLGYFIFFIGLVSFIFMFGPIAQAEARYRIDKLMGVKRAIPNVYTSEGQDLASSFASLKTSSDNIVPVSTDFGIVIEKINANAKIIPNVDPGNEAAYTQALAQGVAQAAGSTEPGKPGNLYLFSHSTDAPWNVVRYNAIFYLLRELEVGDRVVIFYQNRRFDYIVFDKAITDPSDISYLTNRYDSSVLTLQTCDPPGTLLHRLIVRAKLASN